MNLIPAALQAAAISPIRSRVEVNPGLAGPPAAVTIELGDVSAASRWYPHQLIDQITYDAPVPCTMDTNAGTLKSAACWLSGFAGPPPAGKPHDPYWNINP